MRFQVYVKYGLVLTARLIVNLPGITVAWLEGTNFSYCAIVRVGAEP